MEFRYYPWCDFINCKFNVNGQCHSENYNQCSYTQKKFDSLMNNMNFGNREIMCPYCGKRFRK